MRKLNKAGFSHLAILVVVLVVVAAFGTYLLVKSHAEPSFLTDSNSVLAEYESFAPLNTTVNAAGNFVNQINPGDVIVMGDGTLYCNIVGDGTTTQAKLPPGQVKNIFDNLHTPNAAALAHRQLGNMANTSLNDITGVVIINGTDGAQYLYNTGDTAGIFTASVQALQKWCTTSHPTQVVPQLPQLADLNPTGDPSLVSKLNNLFGIGQAYALTKLGGGNMQNDILTHRNSNDDSTMGYSPNTTNQPKAYEQNSDHTPPGAALNYSPDRVSCMDSIAYSWTAHMISSGGLSHNYNLLTQIHNQCSSSVDWDSEAVGEGMTENSVFAGFLQSCPHHEIIDDRLLSWNSHFLPQSSEAHTCYTSWPRRHQNKEGIGAYTQSNGVNWYTLDFAHW